MLAAIWRRVPNLGVSDSLQSAGQQLILNSLSETLQCADIRLTRAVDFLYNLQNALQKRDRTQLIISVTEALNALQVIITSHDMEIQPDDIHPMIRALTSYLDHLEGKVACTQATLHAERDDLIRTAAPLYQRLQALRYEQESPQVTNLTQSIPNFISTAIHSVAEGGRSITGGQNLSAPGAPANEDIDLPLLEIINEATGETRTNNREASSSGIMWLVTAICTLATTPSRGVAPLAKSALLQMLEVLSSHTTSSSDDVQQDIQRARAIAEAISANSSTTEVIESFSQIKELLLQHPIRIGNFANLSLASLPPNEEPASKLFHMKQALNWDTAEEDMPLDDIALRNLAEEVAQIGSYQATYQALTYFVGNETNIPSFATIMDRVADVNPGEKRAAVISELRALIADCPHTFFLKRFALWLFVSPLLSLSELCIKSSANSAYEHLQQFVLNAQNPASSDNDVSESALARLKATAESFYTAHIQHYTTNNGVYGSEVIALENYVKTNQNFLRNHGSLSEIFHIASDLIINRYMFSFKPTLFLTQTYNSILQWVSNSKHALVSLFLSIVTFPIVSILWTINRLIVFPIEWTVNKIIHFTAKKILRNTNALEYLCDLTKSSLFPKDASSLVMNTVIHNLLEKLSNLMNAPSDPNSTFFTTDISPHDADSNELASTLRSILELVAISENHSAGEIHRFLQRSNTSSIDDMISMIGKSLFGKDLDGAVIKLAKDILTRSFLFLMTPEIINQQLYFILESSKKGMLAHAHNLTEEERTERMQKEEDLKGLINLNIASIIRKSVTLLYKPESDSDDFNLTLKNELQQMQANLNAHIDAWQTRIQESGDLTIDTLQHLLHELASVIDNLEHKMLQLERSPVVDSGNLNTYKRNLNIVIDALNNYEHALLNIYHIKLTNALENHDTISDMLWTLNQTLSSLSENPDLAPNLETLRGLYDSLHALTNTESARGLIDLRRFINTYHYFITNRAPRCIESERRLQKFQAFQEAIATCSTIIETHTQEPRLIRIYFQDLHNALGSTLNNSEMRELEETIITNPSDYTSALQQLQTLVNTTAQQMETQHNKMLQETSATLNTLSTQAASQYNLLTSIQDAPDIAASLRNVSLALASLQHRTSINIPIGNAPFIGSATDQASELLQELVPKILSVFTNRAAFTGVITREVVIPFIESA